jgi:diacylglycerol kinase family enzyme
LSGEADGESIGKSDFSLRILPHQLRVICGEDQFVIPSL